MSEVKIDQKFIESKYSREDIIIAGTERASSIAPRERLNNFQTISLNDFEIRGETLEEFRENLNEFFNVYFKRIREEVVFRFGDCIGEPYNLELTWDRDDELDLDVSYPVTDMNQLRYFFGLKELIYEEQEIKEEKEKEQRRIEGRKKREADRQKAKEEERRSNLERMKELAREYPDEFCSIAIEVWSEDLKIDKPTED